MKRFKAYARAGVSLLMAAALLAGCSSPSSASGGGTSAGGTNTELLVQPGETNEYGWVVPEETLKISVYAGMGDPTEAKEKQKPMDEFYKKYFNVEIDMQWYSIDPTEKLNLMLAAGDYPDVIVGIDDTMAEKFISQKKAWDLAPSVEAYGDNITRRIGKYLNLVKTDDGQHLYKLPTRWGETPNVAGLDFAARYDYWQETGLPMYTTLDEYYTVLKAILEKHPTTANGEKVYAISDNSKDNYPKSNNMLNAMLGAYGFKNGFQVNESTGEFTHWMNTPEGLEIAKYINRFYREGMIDPDFLNNNYETWLTKTFNEAIVGNIGTWWHVWTAGHEKWAQEEGDAYQIDKRFMNATLDVPGVTQPTYLASNFIGRYRVIITDKVKDQQRVDEIVKFLNWECSELGNFIVGYGPPSETNVWNIVDGKWIFKDNTFDNATKNENVHMVKEAHGAQTIWLATSGGLMVDDRIDPRVSRVSAYDFWPVDENGEFLDEGVRISWQNVRAKPWDSTLFQVSYDATNPISTTYQTITDQLVIEWAAIITSDTEEAMEKQFYTSQDKLNKLGLKELTQYNQQEYEKNKEKLNR